MGSPNKKKALPDPVEVNAMLAEQLLKSMSKDYSTSQLAKQVAQAGKDAPLITSVTALQRHNSILDIPYDLDQSAEYEYGWSGCSETDPAFNTVEQKKASGWELVTRVNHPNLPDDAFGEAGAIVRHDNVLMFMSRKTREVLQRKNLEFFSVSALEDQKGRLADETKRKLGSNHKMFTPLIGEPEEGVPLGMLDDQGVYQPNMPRADSLAGPEGEGYNE